MLQTLKSPFILLDKKNYGLLRYEELVDAKTRLKELFDQDVIKSTLGQIKYIGAKIADKIDPITGRKLFVRKIEITYPNRSIEIISNGEGYESKDAETNAAQIALNILESRGFKSNPLPIWQTYC